MKKTTLLCMASLVASTLSSFGTVTILFPDAGPFDQALPGPTVVMPITDGAYSFNLNLVDIFDVQWTTVDPFPAHLGSTHATNGLGINSAYTEIGSTTIDDGEIIRLSFNQDIIFNAITMTAFTDPESGTITFGGGTPIALTPLTTGTAQPIGVSVPAGTYIDIAAAAGTTMGVGSMTVTAVPVPEPSTFALVAGFLSLGLIILRRRCRK